MPGSTEHPMEQFHRIGVQFLLADLATALTFLDVAQTTASEESRSRNLQNARRVYDTVMRLLPRISPSVEERAALEDKLAELKRRLSASRRLTGSQLERLPGR